MTGASGSSDAIDTWVRSKQHQVGLRELLRVLWRTTQLLRSASGGRFYVVTGLQLLGAAMVGAQLWVVKHAIESLLAVEARAELTAPAVTALIGVAVTAAVVTLTGSVGEQYQRLVAEDVQKATWDRVLDVALAVDLEVYEKPDFFDHLSRIQTSAIQRPLDIARGLVAVVGGAAGVVVLVAVLLPIHPLLPPVLALSGVPLWAVTRMLAGREVEFVRSQARHYRDRNYLRGAMLDREQAKEVRACGLQQALRSKYDAHYEQYRSALAGLVGARVRLVALTAFLSAIVLLAGLSLLLWLLASGRVSFAAAAVAALTMKLLTSRLDQVVRGVGALTESTLFMADLDRFSDWLTVVAGRQESEATAPGPFTGIRLEGVGFAYPGAARAALGSVDVEVRAGEVVALVGENGSGKTTLAKIAAGLYQPTSGKVLWNGLATDSLDRQALRDETAVIFQDFARWQLSAADNVRFGRPGRADDDERVRAAAARAGVAEAIEHLPSGWASVLSRGQAAGSDLSLGQWQRIALARALYRGSPFVVLDEPTSALDPRAEADLLSSLRGLFEGRGVLIISHRFSSVRHADRIYVLEAGRIVESGSHAELVAREGLYADLFTLQARAYLDPASATELVVDGV